MHDTVLFDVDTQNDFLLPVGALYVPGAEKLIPTFERIYNFARAKQIPVIASVDAHSDRDPEFASWPPHCIAGTLGQAKIPGTLLAGAVTIPNRTRTAIPDAPQLIVEKQTIDVFETATMAAAVAARPAKRYVVFGVVTEICVWTTVQGLRKGGHTVEVITDAIASLDAGKGRAALDAMHAAGARFINTEEFVTAAKRR
jgi:nicotinamidase/pyrazinamidase